MWDAKTNSDSWVSDSVGTSWTSNGPGDTTVEEFETIRDGSTVATGSDDDYEGTKPTLNTNASDKQENIEQVLSPSGSLNESCICLPYKIEKLEQQLFNHSPGSSRKAAIIETLRQSKYR